MAVAQRFHGGLDNEIRRAEVGLADTEIDDVAALRRQIHGAREHGEGVFFADAVEGGNGLEHGHSLGGLFLPPQFNPKALQM
jgi:hypothetical protein